MKSIPVADDPNWIVFSADENSPTSAAVESNEISVISVAELREVKRVKTGGEGSARVKMWTFRFVTAAARK